MKIPYSALAVPLEKVRLNTRPQYWHCEQGWEWRALPLPDYLLWFITDGLGQVRLDNQNYDLRPGSCFVSAPDAQPHAMQDPQRRLVVFGMHFDFLDAQDQPLSPSVVKLPPCGQLVRDTTFFATLAQRCEACFRRGDAIGGLQSRFFLQEMLLHLWEEALYPPPSAVDVAIDNIIRAIQQEPGRQWSITQMARQTHLSRAQFARRFEAVTGHSPTHFVIQARLERARQLIQETDMTLSQIAEVLGYQGLAFFSRQYKHYRGHAPSTLRRPTLQD